MKGIIYYQVIFYFAILLLLVKPLGWYMAQIYEGKPCGLNYLLAPFEKFIYRLCSIKPDVEMSWKRYLSAMLLFNLLGVIFVYCILRLQFYLPFNPQAFPGVAPDLSFNTAASFTTNTNWQNYSGESTLSYFSQMVALTVQNFLSAATGTALLVAFIRGLARRETNKLGNYWVDMVRGTLYIYLPLALVLAAILVSQGVIQNFKSYEHAHLLQSTHYQTDVTKNVTEQIIPMGPVASQVAIKQLGTNGGGFFNTNSAHPFENPTPLSNFFEMLAIILIPAALCFTFGYMINDKRQAWAIFITMLLVLLPMIIAAIYVERVGNPIYTQLGIGENINMEGKETRLGVVNSALWATLTTATGNGSVNAMLDSFTPIGGLTPLLMMHLGEVIFGGVGSGLYGMIMLIIITVFIAGLMVGRTPEYLGKKIEPYEIKMASIAILIMPLIVLILTAVACVTHFGLDAIFNPGTHGFTELLYAFTSMGNNNGSAFAGLKSNTPFFNIVGALEMLLIRFWIAIAVLAVAGSLVRKRSAPSSTGTLATHTPLFIIMLIGVTVIVGALTFLPTLALGPIVEHIHFGSQHVPSKSI